MADVSGSNGTGRSPSGGDRGPSGGGDKPSSDICVFCLDPNDDSTACYSTACPLHISHKDCLLRWLKIKRSCPTCRTSVTDLLMKSGESVALPPLEFPVELASMSVDELRREFYRRYEELTASIRRRQVYFAPPVPVESGVNQPVEAAVSSGGFIRAERLREERTREEVDGMNLLHPGSGGINRFRARINTFFDQIGQPRIGDSSASFTNSAENVQLELEGTGERRRREGRLASPDEEVVRDSVGEETLRGEDEREGVDSSEERDSDDDSDSSHSNIPINDDQPCSSTSGNQVVTRKRVVRFADRLGQPLVSRVSFTRSDDEDNIQLGQEEVDERIMRANRVWGTFDEVVRTSAGEERARGDEERTGGIAINDDQPCSSTSGNQGVRRKRKVTISDEVEVRKMNGDTKRRRMKRDEE